MRSSDLGSRVPFVGGNRNLNQKTLILTPQQLLTESGWTSIRWVASTDQSSVILRHEIPDRYRSDILESRGDHILTSVLLHAMERSLDIHVEGVISPKLLNGLNQLQTLWSDWRSDKYTRISISADRMEEAIPSPAKKGLFTFSGGVDSTYSLLHHLNGSAEKPIEPGGAVFVHGADIPLDDENGFEAARERSEKILDGTGIEIIPIRTNSRELACNWEDSHGLEISACLLLFQKNFSTGVMAGWGSAEEVVYPWGSTPISDPLASTEAMTIVHDGLERNRIEKVRWLSRFPIALKNIRVCWEGEDRSSNCGRCEKCVRTLLDFWALGLPSPEAIHSVLSPELIHSIRPSDLDHIEEWKTLFATASKRLPYDDRNLMALEAVIREDMKRIRWRRLRKRFHSTLDFLLARK